MSARTPETPMAGKKLRPGTDQPGQTLDATPDAAPAGMAGLAGEIAVVPLGAAFCGVAAGLHRQGFADAWDEEALITLLSVPGAVGFLAFAPGNTRAGNMRAGHEDGPPDLPLGFVLFQSVLDEAEITTITVASAARGHGVGRVLLMHGLSALQQNGVTRVLLEVAEDNASAIALYDRCGFTRIGRRKRYYRRDPGPDMDALVMEWHAGGA